MQCEVETALRTLEERGLVPHWAALMEFWPSAEPPGAPDLAPLSVELADYDRLLSGKELCA
jgi:hypothetical protein